jgi:Ca-activated chloride channel family protein
LRIRLAPGVKLVDVLGSRRLDAPQAARVREAERAIDRRLARNLGITADRGADEEGIQIVIPNFYAGDSHVVLLDVVAERPGPIADVTARYKDVVFLKNGVAHARLTIPAGERPAGPLERNVLKNLLAYELAREARRYGDYFEAGRTAEAAAMIARLKALVRGLRFEVEGWSTDGDLAADEAALAGYLRVLGSPQATDPVQRRYLADSLRYAAFSKLHSRRK